MTATSARLPLIRYLDSKFDQDILVESTTRIASHIHITQPNQEHMGPTIQNIEHDEDHGELLDYVEYVCAGRDAMVQAVMSKVTGWFDGSHPIWQYRPHNYDIEWCDFEMDTCCFIEEAWSRLTDPHDPLYGMYSGKEYPVKEFDILAPDGENRLDVMTVNFKTWRCGVMSIRRMASPCVDMPSLMPSLSGPTLPVMGPKLHVVNDCPERDAIVNNIVKRVTTWFDGDYPLWEYAHGDAWIPWSKETCCFIEAGWAELSDSAYQILTPNGHDDNDMMWINLNTMRSGVVPIRRRTTLVPGGGHVVRFESFREAVDGSISDVHPIEDPYFLAQLNTFAIHKGRVHAYAWTQMGWFEVIKDGMGCALCAHNAPRMRIKRLECQECAWIRPDAATVLCQTNLGAPAA